MKFRISIICVVLLVCGLQLSGQQEDSASPAMLDQRLGRPGSRAREMMTQRSKPALGGAQTAEPSNDLPRNDDSGTYITLDAPGAGTGVNQRTFPLASTRRAGLRDIPLTQTTRLTALCETTTARSGDYIAHPFSFWALGVSSQSRALHPNANQRSEVMRDARPSIAISDL